MTPSTPSRSEELGVKIFSPQLSPLFPISLLAIAQSGRILSIYFIWFLNMSYCLNPHCQKPQNQKHDNFCLTCGYTLLLKERYRAIKPIGQGGFGRTLLAVDESKPLKPPCVIKQFLLMAQGTSNTQKAAELFEQEALRLGNLGKHDRIPGLLDYLIQEEHQYLVQEYIDGHNLAEILKEQSIFNEQQIWDLLNSLLPIVEYIHAQEVIHRDIKPENIIRARNGKLFLVDFGAAKVVTGTAILQTGTSIGTPEFVAPEQSRGKAIYSSDLYSLGTTCIYLLTGISPFDLFDISEYTWVWRQYLVNNSVSDQLGHILDKLIQNATSRRYQSASEVLKDINPPAKHELNNNSQKQFSFKLPNKLLNSETVQPLQPLNQSSWRLITDLLFHTAPINSIAISPDGKFLASGSNDNTIKILEINTRKIKWTFNNESSVNAVAFSPDGKIFASGDRDSNIQFWDVNSGDKLRLIKGHMSCFYGVTSLSFSPDSKILVSAGGDETVKLWDVSTGLEIRTLRGHDRWIGSVVISSNGEFLASSSVDQAVILWELNSGRKLYKLDHAGMFSAVRSVAFSPNARIIATASEDCTIKLWKVNTGQEICIFKGHENFVRDVTFNPKFDILASSSDSNDIKLWDINTKQEICTLRGHSGDVNSLIFSPDGRTLFSGSEDNSIKAWRYE